MWLLWHFHEKISLIWIACNYKERTLIHFLSLLRSRVIVWCRWGGVLCCYYTHRADRQYWYTLIEAVYHNTAQLPCWLRSPRGWRCLLCISYEGSVFVHKSPAWITMLEHSPSSDFISRLMTSSPSNFISPQCYSASVFFVVVFFSVSHWWSVTKLWTMCLRYICEMRHHKSSLSGCLDEFIQLLNMGWLSVAVLPLYVFSKRTHTRCC